jgi:hypothetical protein
MRIIIALFVIGVLAESIWNAVRSSSNDKG